MNVTIFEHIWISFLPLQFLLHGDDNAETYHLREPHLLSTVRDADHVIVIKNGDIAEQGTHRPLLEAEGIFHKSYMSQFKGLAI